MVGGGPADAHVIVENRECLGGEGVEGVIERLLVFSLLRDEGLVEKLPELLSLLLADGHDGPETEFLLQHLLHLLPGGVGGILAPVACPVGERVFRYLLRVGICDVVGSAVASEAHASGVVVGGHYDQCLRGMAQIELIGHIDGVLEIEDLLYHSAAVVGVGGPVDVAPFDHHEELLGVYVFKGLETRFRDLGACHGSGYGVDRVAYLSAGGVFGIHQHLPWELASLSL